VVSRVVTFFFSSRRRHTRFKCDWSSDVCSSDLARTCASAREKGDEFAAFGPRALAHGRAQRDLKGGDGVVAAQRELDRYARDERSEERRVGKGWRSGGGAEM